MTVLYEEKSQRTKSAELLVVFFVILLLCAAVIQRIAVFNYIRFY